MKQRMTKFTRKTKIQLQSLSLQRLKSYYRAEKKRLYSAFQICGCCGERYLSDEEQEMFDVRHKYLMFIKSILKQKEKQ